MRDKTISIFISIAVFMLTLGLVEYVIGWQLLCQNLLKLTISTLLLLTGLTLASYLCRALRIRVGFPQTAQSPFALVFYLSAYHTLLNNLLPMRTGEFAFPLLMKKHFQVDWLTSSAQLLLYRLLDLFSLISLAGGLYLVVHHTLWGVLFVLLCVAILVSAKRLKFLLLPLCSAFSPKLTRILEELPIQGNQYAVIVLLTYLLWSLKLSAFVGIILHSSKLTMVQAFLTAVGADLSSILPIHGVAGTGSFEGAFVLTGALFMADLPTLLQAATHLHLFLLLMSLLMWILGYVINRSIELARPRGTAQK